MKRIFIILTLFFNIHNAYATNTSFKKYLLVTSLLVGEGFILKKLTDRIERKNTHHEKQWRSLILWNASISATMQWKASAYLTQLIGIQVVKGLLTHLYSSDMGTGGFYGGY